MVTSMRKMLVATSIDEDDLRTKEFAGYRGSGNIASMILMANRYFSEVSEMPANKPNTRILV
jgi:hypothetical protein